VPFRRQLPARPRATVPANATATRDPGRRSQGATCRTRRRRRRTTRSTSTGPLVAALDAVTVQHATGQAVRSVRLTATQCEHPYEARVGRRRQELVSLLEVLHRDRLRAEVHRGERLLHRVVHEPPRPGHLVRGLEPVPEPDLVDHVDPRGPVLRDRDRLVQRIPEPDVDEPLASVEGDGQCKVSPPRLGRRSVADATGTPDGTHMTGHVVAQCGEQRAEAAVEQVAVAAPSGQKAPRGRLRVEARWAAPDDVDVLVHDPCAVRRVQLPQPLERAPAARDLTGEPKPAQVRVSQVVWQRHHRRRHGPTVPGASLRST
jgi:hypothetical protein